MSEAFTHVNRRGDAYYLQCKPGKDGKPRYSFARQLTGSPAKELPEGYEIRENPQSAQVTLRRPRPSLIAPREKELLEEAIRRQKPVLLFIVDVEDRSLVVYTSDLDADARVGLLSQVFPVDDQTAHQMKAYMIRNARYQKMMRFTLTDADKRLFDMDRWCFKGAIDNWFPIAAGQPLRKLAAKYVRHLDQDSFFELM